MEGAHPVIKRSIPNARPIFKTFILLAFPMIVDFLKLIPVKLESGLFVLKLHQEVLKTYDENQLKSEKIIFY
jgi:hypothetical protein